MAGLVTRRQRPGTARVVTVSVCWRRPANTNVVVWRDVAERQRRALIASRLLIVLRDAERQGPVTHLIASELTDASYLVARLAVAARVSWLKSCRCALFPCEQAPRDCPTNSHR